MFRWLKKHNKETQQSCMELNDYNECNLISQLKASIEQEKKIREELSEIQNYKIPFTLYSQYACIEKVLDYYKNYARDWHIAYIFHEIINRGKLDEISAAISILSYLRTMIEQKEKIEEKLKEEKRIQKDLKEKLGII